MKMKISRFFSRLHRNESGAMSVEKILILALIALPIIIILIAFKGVITGWFSTQQTTLQQDAPTGG
jgi:Flp pilus assembly pilin Flp